MSLGLPDGTVCVVEYDASWVSAYETEHEIVSAALKGLDPLIEHVGSTSVPGLDAKPIVDVAVGSPAGSEPEFVRRLEAAGYEYRGFNTKGGHVLVRRSVDGLRTHHLHVVPVDGEQWRLYLIFRELLRRDPVARHEYSSLKKELAVRFPRDRRAYLAGKDDVVATLLARAEVSGARI